MRRRIVMEIFALFRPIFCSRKMKKKMMMTMKIIRERIGERDQRQRERERNEISPRFRMSTKTFDSIRASGNRTDALSHLLCHIGTLRAYQSWIGINICVCVRACNNTCTSYLSIYFPENQHLLLHHHLRRDFSPSRT